MSFRHNLTFFFLSGITNNPKFAGYVHSYGDVKWLPRRWNKQTEGISPTTLLRLSYKLV